MKIYIVQGGHPSIHGNPMQPHATRVSANTYAAELVNFILADYTDDEDEYPKIVADATADTWEAKCLEYRQMRAVDLECDLDDLNDSDAGDVWIVEEELQGYVEAAPAFPATAEYVAEFGLPAFIATASKRE